MTFLDIIPVIIFLILLLFLNTVFFYIFLSVLNSYPATRFLITPLLARPRPDVELLFIYILFYLPHHSSN